MITRQDDLSANFCLCVSLDKLITEMLEEDADHQSENASNNQEGTFPPLDLPQLTTEPRAEKVCASKASVKVKDVSCPGSLPVTENNDCQSTISLVP